jgi:hypothetical protein
MSAKRNDRKEKKKKKSLVLLCFQGKAKFTCDIFWWQTKAKKIGLLVGLFVASACVHCIGRGARCIELTNIREQTHICPGSCHRALETPKVGRMRRATRPGPGILSTKKSNFVQLQGSNSSF